MSVRGKPKVHNELGFALMAVNLRKYSAINNENSTFSSDELRKRLCLSFLIITTFFYLFETSYVPTSFLMRNIEFVSSYHVVLKDLIDPHSDYCCFDCYYCCYSYLNYFLHYFHH